MNFVHVIVCNYATWINKYSQKFRLMRRLSSLKIHPYWYVCTQCMSFYPFPKKRIKEILIRWSGGGELCQGASTPKSNVFKCSVPVNTFASWCNEMSLDRFEISFRVKDVHKFVRHLQNNVLDKSEIFESAQLKCKMSVPKILPGALSKINKEMLPCCSWSGFVYDFLCDSCWSFTCGIYIEKITRTNLGSLHSVTPTDFRPRSLL